MKNLFRVLRYATNYKGYALLNILFNIVSTIFSVFSLTMIIPFLDLIFLRNAVDYEKYLSMGDPSFEFSIDYITQKFYYTLSSIISTGDKADALVFLCILIITMIFFKNLCRYLALFYIAQIRNGVMRDIRNDMYEKAVSLPLSYYTKEKKGDIIARMSNDVQEIEWTIMTSIEMIFKDPISLIAFFTAMIFISAKLTLFVFVLLPITGFIIGRIGKSLKETSAKGQEKMGGLISLIEEMLTGLRIIKAFNAEKVSTLNFRSLNEEYKKLMVRMYRKRDLSAPMSEFLGVAVLVVVIWFGGKLVLAEDESLGASAFIAFIAIFSQLIPPAKSFTTAYYNIQKGAASEERISVIMKAENIITEKPDAKPIADFTNEIEYRDVSFKYEKEEVLQNINFKVEKGKAIALVGHSGGGKSTLADLLPRFYDPTKGEVLVDGTNLRDYKIKDLRGLMGIVTQESILFNDTVFNNIAFGMTGAKKEDVEKAAQIANAHEFIVQMEKGYESNIGDMGTKLSGGQRQRLSIARAIMKNPPILILDEATSSLDTESERLVQEALNNLMKNRTSIVIAHRLSTIQSADEIVVVQEGAIVERGSHNELLSLGGVYKKLFDMQTFA